VRVLLDVVVVIRITKEGKPGALLILNATAAFVEDWEGLADS
jgi:hypothetical protein